MLNEQNATLVQHCFDQLEKDIIDTALKPGQKLRVEELKQRFGIGGSPIREALSRLVGTGLVEMRHNKGFYVADISEENIRDIYQTFNDIETLALKKSIEHGDDKWAAAIVGTLYELSLIENRETDSDCAEWIKRNYAFHYALIAGCNSPTLLQMRQEIYKRFDRYCRMGFALIKNNLEHNQHEHKKLADAVLKRNYDQAASLMTMHIMGSLEEIIILLKKNKFI